MIDKVAKAIGETKARGHGSDATIRSVVEYWLYDDYQSTSKDEADAATAQQIMLDAARRALAAMSEPTEAMLIAARDWSQTKYGKPIGHDAARGCWVAMLTANK